MSGYGTATVPRARLVAANRSSPPPVQGIGNTGGFKMMVQDAPD